MSKDHEREVLEQFQKEVLDEGIVSDGDTIGTDDSTLLRFLRARKLKIEDAKKMLVNCQEWRRTVEGVGMDALYGEIDPLDYPEKKIVIKHWPFYYHKTDKEGRPIHIEGIGRLDINALLREVDGGRLWKALLTNAEFGTREAYPACSKAKGCPVSSTVCLADLKGFSLQKFWSAKDFLKASAQVSKDYYPDTLAKLIVINAPAAFTWAWSIAKAWLDPETREKVVILGSDYTSYLLEHIDAEDLPAEYGGTCTCNGFGGCAFSSDGPWLEGRTTPQNQPNPHTESDKVVAAVENDKEKGSGSMHEAV